jgi:uncharacterized membrane protein YgcG
MDYERKAIMNLFRRFLVHLMSLSIVTLGMAACGPIDDGVQNGSGALSEQRGKAGATKDNDGKVHICHIPPGNPANAHTISVGAPAVQAHLAHGDYVGSCGGGGGGGGGGGSDGGSGGGGDGGGGGEPTCGSEGDSCTDHNDCCSFYVCYFGSCTYNPG